MESTSSCKPEAGFKAGILFQLKLVAQIALASSLVATTILALGLYLAIDSSEGLGYWASLKSIYASKRLIIPTLIVCGLVLIALIGILTWSISLYSTARVTGPLYRFSQNFEYRLHDNNFHYQAIRSTDALHEEARLVQDSNQRLNQHYDKLMHEVEALQKALEECAPPEKISEHIQRVKQQEQKVTIDAHNAQN